MAASAKKYQDVDLYALLGVNPEATEKEIRKAYRKKALDCHPDKNPDNPKAAELFHELSSALELLTDEKGRSIYDRYQQAKKAAQLRNDQLDTKRRKLKSDLEARERNIGVKVESTKDPFLNVEAQLKAEIDRLRKEGSKLLEEEQRMMREQIQKSGLRTGATECPKSLPSRIKIKWKAEKNDETNGGYTADVLRKYLGKYGDISELVILPGKKGSALVEFTTKEGAEMAVSYEKGDLKNPLKLSWLGGKEASHTSNTASAAAPPAPPPSSATLNNNDFESLVLRNLRQAEERKRLIEQMEKEEAD